MKKTTIQKTVRDAQRIICRREKRKRVSHRIEDQYYDICYGTLFGLILNGAILLKELPFEVRTYGSFAYAASLRRANSLQDEKLHIAIGNQLWKDIALLQCHKKRYDFLKSLYIERFEKNGWIPLTSFGKDSP